MNRRENTTTLEDDWIVAEYLMKMKSDDEMLQVRVEMSVVIDQCSAEDAALYTNDDDVVRDVEELVGLILALQRVC